MTDETTAGNGQTAELQTAEDGKQFYVGTLTGHAVSINATCSVCDQPVGKFTLYAALLYESESDVRGLLCRECLERGPAGTAAELRKRAEVLNRNADILASIAPKRWLSLDELNRADLRQQVHAEIAAITLQLRALADALAFDDVKLMRDALRLDFPLECDDIPF